MARPKAATPPRRAGIYWIKEAFCEWSLEKSFSWENEPRLEWTLAVVDFRKDKDYPIRAYLGTEEDGKWESDSTIVIDWIGPLEKPKD